MTPTPTPRRSSGHHPPRETARRIRVSTPDRRFGWRLSLADVNGPRLRVLPLGGLGEIGKNMTVVEHDGRIVVVDVGLRFPTPEMVGIDLVLPDFSYLRERAREIEAIVITHGHEDHLGALPWVLRELAGSGDGTVPPVYGGPLTLAMAKSKLEEHKLKDIELAEVAPGEALELGPFELELIHMTHSIPDSSAVALGTELGTVLITGDYKFDQTPVDGPPADVSRLAELGREGVLLLCGDSTNVDRPGFSPSESGVGPHLEEAFARCEGRIVVTSFASNIHRVQQVVDAAYALDRKVALVGRSMRKNVSIGRQLGHIEVPEGMLVGPREINDFPDERVVIVSTGSQGEPLSALRRMAYRDHPQIELRAGDTVVFSATPVPGNERAVNETIDRLYHIGCDVITPVDAPVHASGHGYAEEIKLMLNLVRPRYVMPFHGDFKRLRLHAQLAEAVGVEPENVFQGDNGLPLDIDARGARFGSREQSGMVFVDGVEIGEIADVALRDRRMLSADGIFIVVATIAEQDGRSVVAPEVIFRGVPFMDQADELIEEIRGTVEDSLARAAGEEIREVDLLQQVLHDDLAQLVYDRLKRRPMVLPVVVEV
jgi:ribonuclease J